MRGSGARAQVAPRDPHVSSRHPGPAPGSAAGRRQCRTSRSGSRSRCGGSPGTNGFVERFNGTVLEEFFRPTMRSRLYERVEALQTDLDAWLHHYNHERTHLGYRNQGRRPWDTVELRQPVTRKTRRLRRQLIR